MQIKSEFEFDGGMSIWPFDTILIHTLLLFANCSNWCRNDVICGWNELYGVQLTCDCNEPSDTAGVVSVASGLLVCDWLGTGAEYICGEVERLSTASL